MMKPYPFVALNHLTVPTAMVFLLQLQPASRMAGRLARQSGRLDRLQVCCGGLSTFHRNIEAHFLAFIQATKACRLNRGNVYKYILTPVLGHDESVPFRGIEPLYCAG